MKKKRQALILSLIREYHIATQEELLEKLKEHGMEVTQATISRDIKELHLIKSMSSTGEYGYVEPTKTSAKPNLNFSSILKDSITNIDYAGNICVLRCHSGMSNAACAAIDTMHWEELVGTLAGDDTVFLLCRTEKDAEQLSEKFKSIVL